MSFEPSLASGGALLSALLGGAALIRGRRSFALRSLAAGCVVLAAEQVLVALGATADSPESVSRWLRLRLMVLAFLPGVWLLFSLSYARADHRQFVLKGRAVVVAVLGLPLLLAGPLGGRLFIGMEQKGGGWLLAVGGAGYVFHVVMVLGAVLVLANLERTLHAASGAMRWQIKFVVLGAGTLFATRIYTASQTLLFRSLDTSLQVVDSIGVLVGLALAALGLARTHLQDLDVYVSPTALFRSLTALLVGIYLLAVGLIAQVLRHVGGSQSVPLTAFIVLLAIVALAALLLSDKLRQSARRFLSRNLHRPQYDYRKEWLAFTERTTSLLDLRALGAAVVGKVAEALGTPAVSLWLLDEGRDAVELAASTALAESKEHQPLRDEDGRVLRQLLEGTSEAIDLSRASPELRSAQAAGGVAFLQAARYCIPLAAGGQHLGLMTLSERGDGEPLSDEDLDLARTFAGQAAASILNLRLAGRLLRAKEMEAFQHLSAFFIHDLKNLASRLSLTMQNATAHFEDPAFRRDMLQTIGRSVTRINEMCTRLSPLSGGLELQRREADLNELVGTTLAGLNGAITPAVKQDLGPVKPTQLDREQMQKVLLNLLLNANDAAGQGGEIRVATSERDGCVILSVSDTGCGMSKDFMARSLFEPFRTTKRQGLGIGLFHARKIVEAHSGRIEVESVEGAGSTFRVILPAGAR